MFVHRLWRKLLIVGGLLLVGSLILVACGGDDDDDPTATTSSGSTEATATTGESSGDSEVGMSELDGPITFGDYGWDSALVHNAIARYIIDNGYGYETDSIAGETITLFQGLLDNDVNVAMEIWTTQQPQFEPAVEDGTLLDLGSNFGESVQGWYVPTYVIEGDPERGIEPMAPDLVSVDDLPQYAELFADPEDPSKGRFYNCIAGWECLRVNESKFEFYGLDETYNSFLPGSGPALATSLVSAYETGEPWVGYYWAPTWVFGQVELTMLEEPEYTDECWDAIVDEDGDPTGEAGCAYPSVPVNISVNAEFAETAPDVVAFLDNYETSMDQTSAILAFMQANEAEVEDAAIWFLQNNENQWTAWVPAEVAEKVNAALESETS